MKALFITRKYPPSTGGMEMYAYQLYAHFAGAGGDVDLLKPEPPILGRPRFGEFVRFLIGACRLLISRSKAYDTVLIGDYAIASLTLVAKIASRGKIRTVVSLHGNDLYFMRRKGILPATYRLMSYVVTRSGAIDRTIANSRAIQTEAALHGLPSAKVIPLAACPPPPGTSFQKRNPKQVLFAGRLIRYKGLSWFVKEIWPHFQLTHELLVAGPLWDTAERECLADQQGITYLGNLHPEDLRELQARVALCIMPNLPPGPTEQDEGFGLVALESASAGTPVVASACGGIPDAICEKVTGFLAPPMDSQVWVALISEILSWDDSVRESWGRAAKEYVATHYNWTLVAERTLSVLKGDCATPSAQSASRQ